MAGGCVWCGGMHGKGCAWRGGVRGRRDGHCSGRYILLECILVLFHGKRPTDRRDFIVHFFPQVKQHWIGPNYTNEGVAGNDIARTNVPDVRIYFRHETFLGELTQIFHAVKGFM